MRAMIFTTYGRSMMCQVCGAMFDVGLLQQHLETKGPGWYSLAEREERLFTNRSNQPGDDMKDELRTDNDVYAWEHLAYCTGPPMAATSTSSSLAFSW